MRKEKRWRYYCEFCKKSGANSGHIKQHEKHCTMNPDRLCGMCDAIGYTPQPIAKLITILKQDGVEQVQDTAEGCPACTYAAIRQSGIPYGLVQPYSDSPDAAPLHDYFIVFDFHAAQNEFWQNANEARAEADQHC